MNANIATINLSSNMLKHIESIALSAADCQFSSAFFEKNRENIAILSGFFCLTEIQVVLLCVMINLNFQESKVSILDLSKYLGVAPVSILVYSPELEEMSRLKLLEKMVLPQGSGSKNNKCIDSAFYFVKKEVLSALINRKKSNFRRKQVLDLHDLIKEIESVLKGLRSVENTIKVVSTKIHVLLNQNRSLPFAAALKQLRLDDESLVILLFTIKEYVDNFGSVDTSTLVSCLFRDVSKRISIRLDFVKRTHTLIQNGLLEITTGSNEEPLVSLTGKVIEMLFLNKKNHTGSDLQKKGLPMINTSKEILSKTLYFGQEEQKSIEFLTDILHVENYKNLTFRLKESGLQAGVTALFYGASGTGKTESVYQIAHKTGRDIKAVSISATKSKYFGESERLIKSVFDIYRNEAANSEITPILLFNEADGILGTRKNNLDSPVSQSENAIQNIILQEMENFEGIMIATTNLAENLDLAFERRFLYKIKFDKPAPPIQMRIWKDKIPELSNDHAIFLAKQFNFTGGQIDNVARKCLMHKVLYNHSFLLSDVEKHCMEEVIKTADVKKIGFGMTSVGLI